MLLLVCRCHVSLLRIVPLTKRESLTVWLLRVLSATACILSLFLLCPSAIERHLLASLLRNRLFYLSR